ncbi:hypothetical protein IFM89_007044 [Coptis chinensis]|uniref:RNase H type-1 domain-containing protein n=1 Tax=Coptis chinensis TaxID=261450 RepID=A0A835ILM6_9MAGN|nr:hypothetical protein IFM89_007044 [Coptis chinensis]
MKNSVRDLVVIKNWNVPCKPNNALLIKECKWCLPPPGYMKANCDGAAKGNPGSARIGVTFRDDKGDIRLVMWEKIGVNTNYLAEVLAILEALEVALEREWVNILIESDSSAVIKAFGTGKFPWWLTQRWENIKGKVVNCIFTATWREANFSVDLAANKATTMSSTQTYLFERMKAPAWMFKWESPHLAYFRFVN